MSSNEKKKEDPMKRQILSVAAAFLLSIIAAAQCDAQQTVMKVNIPFAFGAGNTMLPAGEYGIRRYAVGEVVQLIRQSDGEPLILVTTLAVERTGKPLSPGLIFNQYGNDYFLSEIWVGNTQGRQLRKSPLEKELTSTMGRHEVAVLASDFFHHSQPVSTITDTHPRSARP